MNAPTEEELGDIHKDWLKILEPLRSGMTGQEKEKIIDFAKFARIPVNGRMVKYKDIVKAIKDEFSYTVKRTTLTDWVNGK